MILLLGAPDLNEGQHLQSGGEEDLRASVNTTHAWDDRVVLDFQAAKQILKWAKTMAKIVLVSIAT